MRFVRLVYLRLERLPGIGGLLVPARLRYLENCPPGLPVFKRIFVYLALFPGIGRPLQALYGILRSGPPPAPAPTAPVEPALQESAAPHGQYVGYNPRAPLPPNVAIDFESGAENCEHFSQLIIEPDRRLAFEYYRSGMYVRCMAVIDNVFDHYVDVMEMDAEEFAGKSYLTALTGGIDVQAESERLLRAAVSISPDFPEAQFALGVILREKGRLEEALDAHGIAVSSEPWITHYAFDLPVHAKAYLEIGGILEQQGEKRRALDAYSYSIKIDPNVPEANRRLGILMLELEVGDPLEAAGYLSNAMHYRAIISTLPPFPDTIAKY